MALTKKELLQEIELNLQKSQIELLKAETLDRYVKMGVLKPTDVRKWLIRKGTARTLAES